MYGMLGTRPDLAYSISTLSKFNSCPGSEHHEAAKRVLRYLQKTGSYGLIYKGEDSSSFPEARCYTDSDWAGKTGDRKSTAGYVIILTEAADSWKTKRQSVVAQSTMKAEYVALLEAVKESIWIRRLLREIETGEVPREAVDPADYHEKEMALQWELRIERESRKRTTVSSTVSDRPQQISVDNKRCIRFTE